MKIGRNGVKIQAMVQSEVYISVGIYRTQKQKKSAGRIK